MDHKIRAATLAAELRQARERIAELEAENADYRHDFVVLFRRASTWKRAAKKVWGEYNSLAEARLKCWNELNEERAIVYKLGQENARLRDILARLTAAARNVWFLTGGSTVYVGREIGAKQEELRQAISEAQGALAEGAEDTGDE